MRPFRLANETALRLCELVAAFAILALLSPMMLVLALVVLIDDGRPVLFRQERIGRHGQPFQIIKFRTMHAGKRKRLPITVKNDVCITRSGAWMRRCKMDELPQFFNVLRGEMSLIGPRPEVPEYVQAEDELWRAVLRSRPGITDLASLAFRDEEELLQPIEDLDTYYRSTLLPAKLRLNVNYQQSRCLSRDFKLLWLTARYSLFSRGFDRQQVLQSFGAHQAELAEQHIRSVPA